MVRPKDFLFYTVVLTLAVSLPVALPHILNLVWEMWVQCHSEESGWREEFISWSHSMQAKPPLLVRIYGKDHRIFFFLRTGVNQGLTSALTKHREGKQEEERGHFLIQINRVVSLHST